MARWGVYGEGVEGAEKCAIAEAEEIVRQVRWAIEDARAGRLNNSPRTRNNLNSIRTRAEVIISTVDAISRGVA